MLEADFELPFTLRISLFYLFQQQTFPTSTETALVSFIGINT